ncbi:30S ribosomal protein S6 [bacterium]|nr:30S ribosomal protein S6 [bacterium]|tara:strand:- start:9833 stop:10252 length:420 start_codon:yes stop_codon:yes gene_type:complete
MYELAYFINPQKNSESVQTDILKLIKELDGQILNQGRPQMQKLAYAIKHYEEGFFSLIDFKIKKKNILELNKKLRLNQNVIRYSIFKKAKISDSAPEIKPKPDKIIGKKLEQEPEAGKDPKVKIDELDEKLDELLEDTL